MNGEQKQKIQKTERALQVAEEELVRVRLEAMSKLQELKEVHRAWLPPWFAYRIVRCQEIVAANWKERGKPALGVLVLKVSEKSGQAQKWIETHLETAKTPKAEALFGVLRRSRSSLSRRRSRCRCPFLLRRSFLSRRRSRSPCLRRRRSCRSRSPAFVVEETVEPAEATSVEGELCCRRGALLSKRNCRVRKWIPAAKARWIASTATVRPHMEKASTKAFEMFEFCRATATPHIFALQEFANPFVQEAMAFVKPYVELAATITKPYVDKASTILKPYAGTVVYGYTNLLETTGTYHHQAQDIVTENLKKHDLTKPLATKEFVWFAASASLALPIFLIYKMLSQFFGKKVVKPIRSTRSHNSHRRHKRRHADQ